MNQEFINDIPGAIKIYPALAEKIKDGNTILAGDLIIRDSSGTEWDRYQVEIHETPLYPYRFPLLYEVGGRIPRIIDWHIYADTGSCCVDITPSEIVQCHGGLRLVEYIERFAIPFFANQTHRFREGYYKNGEYSHGGKGMLEYYMPLLKSSSPKLTLELVQRWLAGKGTKTIFHPCFCGSGKKMNICHGEAAKVFNKIGISELRKNASQIKDFLDRQVVLNQ